MLKNLESRSNLLKTTEIYFILLKILIGVFYLCYAIFSYFWRGVYGCWSFYFVNLLKILHLFCRYLILPTVFVTKANEVHISNQNQRYLFFDLGNKDNLSTNVCDVTVDNFAIAGKHWIVLYPSQFKSHGKQFNGVVPTPRGK